VNGSFNPNIAGVGTHGVSYIIVDEDGCVGSAAQCTTIDLNVGGEEGIAIERGVSIFPNPSRGEFTLSLDLKGLVSVQVFDAQGRLVHTEAFNAQSGTTNKTLDLSNMAKGTYLLKVNNSGAALTELLVIE
jgi:hypothetical protein